MSEFIGNIDFLCICDSEKSEKFSDFCNHLDIKEFSVKMCFPI